MDINKKMMMRSAIGILIVLIAVSVSISCRQGNNDEDKSTVKPRTVKKYRDDGTLLSITQVNVDNFAHGIKVNYYDDGKTVHSKVTYSNGRKDGPAIWYYMNGQIFEHTGFENNLRAGLTKKYYKSGALMAEYYYDQDQIQPGLKEYTEQGALITGYPDVRIREINKLASANKLILEISTSNNDRNVRYYKLVKANDRQMEKSYLDSENGICQMEFYIYPGNVLNKTIEFYVEVPTSLGNKYIIKKNYNIDAMNL